MEIREIKNEELKELLELYTYLHDDTIPEISSELYEIWDEIIKDKNHHIFVAVVNNEIVSSCVMVTVPNLTHNQRPYALIENVVTHASHRNKGYATLVLNFAKEFATKKGCYKIMLMTGSKKEEILNFYKKAGFNADDKTAFIQWI